MTARTILDREEKTYYINSQRFKFHREARGLSLRQCAAQLSEWTTNPIAHVRLFRAEQLHEFGVDEDVWLAIRKVLNV